MNAVVQIVEMDQERDRKTCLSLDLKVTGANRELAQWLLDHPRYSIRMVADWLGCGPTRIGDLRRWAVAGFQGSNHPTEKRKEREDGRRAECSGLITNDNSDSDVEHDEDGVVVEDNIAPPEVLEDNLLHVLSGMNENTRMFNRLLKVSALDREAASRINNAIDRTIAKLRSIQSTLEKKG